MGFDWSEWRDSRVCVSLVLLAHGIAFDIFPHKLCKTWPLEFRGDKLAGFEISRMGDSLVVIVMSKDGVVERVIRENVDPSVVYEDMVIVFPVRQMGPEDSGNVLQG